MSAESADTHIWLYSSTECASQKNSLDHERGLKDDELECINEPPSKKRRLHLNKYDSDTKDKNEEIEDDDIDAVTIKKLYCADMVKLSKISDFIKQIDEDNTLDKFANRWTDGSYILGIPTNSDIIAKIVKSMDDIDQFQPSNSNDNKNNTTKNKNNDTTNNHRLDWIQFDTIIPIMQICDLE